MRIFCPYPCVVCTIFRGLWMVLAIYIAAFFVLALAQL